MNDNQIELITFRRFGSEKNWKKERKLFLKYKKELIRDLSDYKIRVNSLKGINEIKINEIIKQYLEKTINYDDHLPLKEFMKYMGLSYKALSKDEINEIGKMDYTYENWEKKSKILYDNFLKKSKDIFPKEVKFCFEDKFFPLYVVVLEKDVFQKNNYIIFIRDYFILDKGGALFNKYRDNKLFIDLQKKVIKIYPIIKEKYGTNRFFEKFLSYLNPEDESNDYNIEYIKNLLDNYYNKNKNDDELVKLKTE